MGKPFEYKILSTRQTTPSTLVVTLYSPDQQRTLNFEPGQSAAISFMGLNGRLTRQRRLPIANAPTEQRFLQFALRSGSSYSQSMLDELLPGTDVTVEGPFGDFTFQPDRDQSVMLIADGIGIVPLLSMIRYVTRLKLENEVALVYACQKQEEIAYLKELRELRDLNHRFGIMFIVAEGPVDTLEGEYMSSGQIDGQLLDYLVSGSYAPRSYFICGNNIFTENTAALLRAKGAEPDSIMTENLSHDEISS